MAKKEQFLGTGRRKKSIARVRIMAGTGNITVNKRDVEEFFGYETLKMLVRSPFVVTETTGKYDVFVSVKGGGYTGQAGAIRHGIARALVNHPEVLLLDEPLGALDLKLRKEMQLELKRLQREMNITFVYVTHDQEEALTMSDTVVVMNKGKIQQIGSPQDIYNEPRNAFVAKFIGDSNIVDGIMEKDFLVSFGGQEFACVDRGFKPREPVQVVIRPEDVDIVPPSAGKLTGLVREVIFKGVHFEMHVDVEGKEWLIHSTQASQPGELIGMNIGPDEIHIMSREEV